MSEATLRIPDDGYLLVALNDGEPVRVDLWAASTALAALYRRCPPADDMTAYEAGLHEVLSDLGIPPRSGLAATILASKLTEAVDAVQKKTEASGLLPSASAASCTDSPSGP